MDITKLNPIENINFLGRNKSNIIRSYFKNLSEIEFKAKLQDLSDAAVSYVQMQLLTDEAFDSIDTAGWQEIRESYISWKFHDYIDYEEAAEKAEYRIKTIISKINTKVEFEADEKRKNADSDRVNSTGSIYFF